MRTLTGLFRTAHVKTLLVFLLAPTVWAQTVNIWETTADQTQLLSPQANVSFAPDSGTNSYTITVNDTTTYQTMDGFGAAMCDSSGFSMWYDLTTAQRNAAMTQMFDPNNGIGLSLCRLPMGASDMAVSNYSYDDNGGVADPTMANFSIAHDLTYIVPLLKQAVALNPNLKIMGTPWSPPGWMKDSGTMKGGNFLPQYYGAYAQYFVKFVQAYQAQGIPIWSVSCQNEPLYNATGYPGMSFPATQELEFIRNYLGPAFEAAGLNTKILVYDHNWDQYVYPETVLGDPVADFYSLGTAWHWYGGVVSNQQYLQTAFPGKPQWITEAASGTWTGNFGQAIVNDLEQLIIGGTQYWGKGAIKWPLVTDQNYGPQNGGCNTCWGLLTADSNTQTYSKGVGFYTLGHASKFVQPGAYHIQSNTFGTGNIEDVAFKNPDGSDVVVVLNSTGSTQSFKILLNGQSFTYSLPSSAVATFKWSTGTIIAQPTATPTPQSATSWRVVAGGPAHTDCQSNAWSADEEFIGGTGATSTNTITGALPCASDTALYQDQRYGGSFLYAFQAPPGIYQVTLKFAETYWTAAGQRVFNVSINGNQVLTNFDIVATAGGQNRAVDKVFSNIQPDSLGRILIQFGPASADNALVSSIQIVQVGTPTPTATFTRTPTATSTPTPVVASTWRVNAGGPAYTDSQSHVWAADENFSGGTAAVTTSTITGALPGAGDGTLYQSQRYGNPFSYTFNVPAGSYQVTLKFAETYWTAAGQRIFNVSINGSQVLTNFDIFATAGGQNKAIDEVFNNIAPTGGTITIQFGPASVDNAEVQAIQIIPMPPTPTFTSTSTRTFTPSYTFTASPSFTPSYTSSFTPTATSTFSSTPTRSYTPTSTSTSTFSSTFTATSTYSSTNTLSPTGTSTFTRTSTPSSTSTPTATSTASMTPTASLSPTPSASLTPTFTSTATSTSTFTTSSTSSNTATATGTATSTASYTASATASFTATSTSSGTSTATSTATTTSTSSNTATSTSTSTLTLTSTTTSTPTYSATRSFTPTDSTTPTSSATLTATLSASPTRTSTFTSTFTSTVSWTATPTATATSTASFTPSSTKTPTESFTFTLTSTATRTFTLTFTPTRTLSPTPTPGTSVCLGVPAWNGNFVAYAIGAKVTYNGELYQCIQAHTSESTWMPPAVPALWQDLGSCSAVKTASVFPNPATTSNLVNVAVPLVATSDVSLEVYTTNFRKIIHKDFTQAAVGTDLPLELTDDWGGKLANGLYYIFLKSGNHTWTVKLLVLH